MSKCFSVDAECRSCRATGLYSGMGESKTTAVVCHTCKGTGCEHIELAYEPFRRRADKPNIEHVYQVNPGIGVGRGNGFEPADFGGMSYADWKAGKPFVDGMENRRFTCPAWWYQSADYKRKPDWPECINIGAFRDCPRFAEKSECWAKFDLETKEKS